MMITGFFKDDEVDDDGDLEWSNINIADKKEENEDFLFLENLGWWFINLRV